MSRKISGNSLSGREGFFLAGILVGGALVIRAAFSGARLVLTGDEIHYAESLHRFMEGRILDGFSDYWSFLYPFVAVPFGRILGGAEPGLRLLSMIAGAAVLVPCMLIADRLWGKRSALFAGVLIALHPNLISFSTAAMTESFYTLFLMSAVLFLIRYMREGGWREGILTTVFLALAYQTRQEAQFVFLLLIAVVLIGRGGECMRAPVKRRLVRAAVLVVVFVVCILPYTLLLHRKTGRWTGGSKAAVNLSSPLIWDRGLAREEYVYSLNDGGTARRIEEKGRENAGAVLWRQKGVIARRYFRTLNRGVTLLPLLLASPLLLLLVPLGLFGRRWERGSRGQELILCITGAFPFLLYSIFDIELRYLIPFLPLYLLWCGRGCGVIADWIGENCTGSAVLRNAVLAVVFASLIPFTIIRYASIYEGQAVECREIGLWIRDRAGENDPVLAHSGCPVSYYAGKAEATFIPWTDPEGLVRFARHNGYRYIVADEAYFRQYRPTLTAVVDGTAIEGLDPVRTFSGRAGRVFLFSVTTRGGR